MIKTAPPAGQALWEKLCPRGLFKPHSPARLVLVSPPLCRGGHQGTERLSNLLDITQLVRAEPGTPTPSPEASPSGHLGQEDAGGTLFSGRWAPSIALGSAPTDHGSVLPHLRPLPSDAQPAPLRCPGPLWAPPQLWPCLSVCLSCLQTSLLPSAPEPALLKLPS